MSAPQKTREELMRLYQKRGMCRQCGEREHMRYFTVCKHCRYSENTP